MNPHNVDFIIAILAFSAGVYTLLTKRVETRKLCQALPILIGMTGWVLLALLTASALYHINLTGRVNEQIGLWEYVIYRLCMLTFWIAYLRQVHIIFRLPCRIQKRKRTNVK